jgi:hypothetical protein
MAREGRKALLPAQFINTMFTNCDARGMMRHPDLPGRHAVVLQNADWHNAEAD